MGNLKTHLIFVCCVENCYDKNSFIYRQNKNVYFYIWIEQSYLLYKSTKCIIEGWEFQYITANPCKLLKRGIDGGLIGCNFSF